MSPGGLPSTVLPAADPVAEARLAEAVRSEPSTRRDAVAGVVAAYPRFLAAWAALGDAASDTIERYAAYRVGYHRGLDALRAQRLARLRVTCAGPNRRTSGFLRCLRGLQEMAAEIGETDEAERCEQFLHQLDPAGPPG